MIIGKLECVLSLQHLEMLSLDKDNATLGLERHGYRTKSFLTVFMLSCTDGLWAVSFIFDKLNIPKNKR